MDSMIFYKRPASVSQPSRSSVARVTAAQPLTSTAPVASVGITGGNANRNSLHRSYWEDPNRVKVAKMTDLVPKGHPPGQRFHIDDLIQKQGNSRGTGNYLNDEDNDDDDEFPTLEQLVADAKKRRILANAELGIGSIDEKANSRIQDDSPVRCGGSRSSSCQEPIWISDDESDTASQIDNRDLGPDSSSEADCNHPCDADKGLGGGQALSSAITPPSNRPATCRDNDVVHNVQVQSSTDGHKSVLLRGSSVSHQASELQRNRKVTIDSMKHVGREGPDEPEDYVFDVFAEEEERDSAVSGRNSNPSTKISKQQNSQRAAHFPEPAPTVAAPPELDPKDTLPPAHRPDARESHSGKPITDPNNLWKIRTIMGKKIIRSRAQYCVEWEPTWQLESELAKVKGLLDEFEAKLQIVQDQSEGGRGKRDRKAPLATSNKLWKVRNILGRRIIGGMKQYWVDWMPTWEPESELTEAKELIDEFVAKLDNTKGQRRSRAAIEELDTRSESEPRKRQRRTQKQERL